MSVDDWARREAEREFLPYDRGAAWMATHALSALLSDEAVEAAARALTNYEPQLRHFSEARAALQAAIDAVTKEEC